MKKNTAYKTLNILIAITWLLNGLFAKVLNYVPRHQQIVAEIIGAEYAFVITKAIGIAEIIMFIWIISGYKKQLNAILQVLVIGLMNVLEFILIPDLLLWGKFNLVFAILFMFLIYYNQFVLGKKVNNT